MAKHTINYGGSGAGKTHQMCSDLKGDVKQIGYAKCTPSAIPNENLVMTVIRDGKGAPLFFQVQTADSLRYITRGIVRITAKGPTYEWSTSMEPKTEAALNRMADSLIS